MSILSAVANGKVVSVSGVRKFETKKGQGGTRTIVIKNDDEYGNTLQFEHTKIGDYYKFIDEDFKIKAGDSVTAEINVETIEYTKKDGSGQGYFTKVAAWKLTKNELPNSDGGQEPMGSQNIEPEGGEDDLPF
jgi:hypothetical protein